MLPYQQQRTRCRQARRRGAAAVEFAVVAMVLLLLIFAIIEFGRAMMVKEVLAGAARAGARAGAVTSGTYDNIQTIAKARAQGGGVRNPTVKVFVNGAEKTSNGAFAPAANDTIQVQVTAPYKDNSWLPGNWFNRSASAILSEKADMKREG